MINFFKKSIVIIVAGIALFGVHPVAAQTVPNPDITIEIQSYDVATKKLQIKGTVTVYETGSYTIAAENSQAVINPITGKKPQQLLYASFIDLGKVKTKQTEIFPDPPTIPVIELSNINPGQLTITPVWVSGTTKTYLTPVLLTVIDPNQSTTPPVGTVFPNVVIQLQSYDPVTKIAVLKGSVTAVKTGTYQLSFRNDTYANTNSNNIAFKNMLFPSKYITAGTTLYFNSVQVKEDVDPGNLDISAYLNPFRSSNHYPISGASLDIPTTAINTGTTVTLPKAPAGTVSDIFPSGTDSITMTDTTAILSGLLEVNKSGKYSVNLLFGTDATNITQTVVLLNNISVNFLTKQSWSQTITGLTPCTDYVYTLRNTITDTLISPVYKIKTTGTDCPVTTTDPVKTSPFGPSPAGTDNSGQGGIFSYQYPTNIGEPTPSGWSIFGSTASLVPCTAQGDITTRCRFNHLMQLIANVANFLLVLLLPCIAIMAAVTGMQMVWHQKKPDSNVIDIMKYKQRFFQVMIGLVVILISWMIVATVLNAVLGDDAKKYVLLDLASLK